MATFGRQFGGYENIESTTIYVKFLMVQALYRFTELEGGYLGMAPRLSRPGEVMAILKGCKVPPILRKHEDHYIFIGTSNILGLMDGEAKELYDSGRARFEDIQIR
jgi:hypothetical protein